MGHGAKFRDNWLTEQTFPRFTLNKFVFHIQLLAKAPSNPLEGSRQPLYRGAQSSAGGIMHV